LNRIFCGILALLLITLPLFAGTPTRHAKYPPSDNCSGRGYSRLDSVVYTICFDSSSRIPRWVSWNTTSKDYGSAPRIDKFHHDDRLFVPQASSRDYAGSGYDKGHVVPSGERTSSPAANFETFSFLNMMPQTHGLNGGPWYKLENDIKGFVTRKSGNQVYVLAGPIFKINSRRIGAGVVVPDFTWKGVVYMSGGMVVGSSFVIMPQDSTLMQPWQMYEVKKEQLESAIGFKLFTGLLP